MHVDASGCKYEEAPVPEPPKQILVDAPIGEQQTQQNKEPQFHKRQAIDDPSRKKDSRLEDKSRAELGHLMREGLSEKNPRPAEQTPLERVHGVDQAIANCDPQGLIPSICTNFCEDV